MYCTIHGNILLFLVVRYRAVPALLAILRLRQYQLSTYGTFKIMILIHTSYNLRTSVCMYI